VVFEGKLSIYPHSLPLSPTRVIKHPLAGNCKGAERRVFHGKMASGRQKTRYWWISKKSCGYIPTLSVPGGAELSVAGSNTGIHRAVIPHAVRRPLHAGCSGSVRHANPTAGVPVAGGSVLRREQGWHPDAGTRRFRLQEMHLRGRQEPWALAGQLWQLRCVPLFSYSEHREACHLS
jgi:hypothetical protein